MPPSDSANVTPAAKPKLITFHRMVPTARLPQRADRSAAGSLPTRAFRYCEPATSASGFGYYMFPPIGFSVMWDGHDIIWTYEGVGEWFPLKSVQFPGFRDQFDTVAPDEIKEFSPPFLGALQESGLIQLWTGFVVRTAPGYSLLVRAPANLPRSGGYEHFEGIVETDRWFGPLFINLRMTCIDTPVELSADRPLFQVQPLLRETYADRQLKPMGMVPGLDQMPPGMWARYRQTVVGPNSGERRQPGAYAVGVRKRLAAEG